MRQIVLDTETTGLDPFTGHRVVEIGCIEVLNGIPSGQTFHAYINPERDMPQEAFAVHGLSAEFLKTHPCFVEIVEDFLAFVGDAPLVAHNASFDLGFLNAELDRAGKPALGRERVIDTLLLARRRFPGTSNRLDDLCQRFGIDNSRRTKHGALLDAELLAEVYLELTGARQAQLGLAQAESAARRMQKSGGLTRPMPLVSRVSDAARAAHRAFVETLGAAAIWRDYLDAPEAQDSAVSEKLSASA
jgi:DNA polymerase III subunit epsilon